MKTIGFAISEKEHEFRRAITLEDFSILKHKENVYFEKGYFDVFGLSDEDIKKNGGKILSKGEIYKCDVIVDPKIGDSDHLAELKNQTIFGWVHATQNYDITEQLINNSLTAIAWEKMFEGTRHIFSGNNIIAGESAILHAMTVIGEFFHEDKKVAILGNGNTSFGAQKVLKRLGIEPVVYNRDDEEKFKNEFAKYDIIVNCILWDVNRKDHILYTKDLDKMKPGSIIIDVSCDHNGGIESSHPTTIENPIFMERSVLHYAVDHTPSILYRDATKSISKEVVKYINMIANDNYDSVLSNAVIIKDGNIVDTEIIEYQNR